MSENIFIDDDRSVGVIVVGDEIIISVTTIFGTSGMRLDCAQARTLAATLIRALQVACADKLRQVQEES